MAERDLDNTGVFGELRRMVQTTGTVGGIAARLAGHKMVSALAGPLTRKI